MLSEIAPAATPSAPPPAKADTDHAENPGEASHPVRTVHGGVRVERLLVELTRELVLHAPEYDGGNDAVRERRDHHPACPDAMTEQLEEAEARVLRPRELHDRVDQDE
jgi:hypothetical protein